MAITWYTTSSEARVRGQFSSLPLSAGKTLPKYHVLVKESTLDPVPNVLPRNPVGRVWSCKLVNRTYLSVNVPSNVLRFIYPSSKELTCLNVRRRPFGRCYRTSENSAPERKQWQRKENARLRWSVNWRHDVTCRHVFIKGMRTVKERAVFLCGVCLS